MHRGAPPKWGSSATATSRGCSPRGWRRCWAAGSPASAGGLGVRPGGRERDRGGGRRSRSASWRSLRCRPWPVFSRAVWDRKRMLVAADLLRVGLLGLFPFTLASIALARRADRVRRAGGGPEDEHLRYHRWARRTLLVGGMMLGVALLPGFMVPGLSVLLLLWALNGAGQALASIPSLGLLADHTQPEERGRAYAAHFALTHLFWLFTYPAAGYPAREIGTPATFTVAGVFCLLHVLVAGSSAARTAARWRVLSAPSRSVRERNEPRGNACRRVPHYAGGWSPWRAQLRPRAASAAAFAFGLHGRAGNRTVRAEHAAVARLRPEELPAARALVEELARVLGHRLLRHGAASRAGEHRNQGRLALRRSDCVVTAAARCASPIPIQRRHHRSVPFVLQAEIPHRESSLTRSSCGTGTKAPTASPNRSPRPRNAGVR